MNKILFGSCIDGMKTLPNNSVDAIVTDPPYELGFMGKSWDSTGIAYSIPMWKEALRVLKPGGHLLAFSGTRTYHRMTCAIEDAGFDIRDQIAWCYGQGFPKSLNISLQIKKKYNIGLCTCNVFEPMLELGYENSNNKRDNISNGEDDRLGSGKQIQYKRDDNNEMAEQIKDTNLSPDNAFRKESGVCELSEKDNKKEQGFEKVSESILQSEVCKPISEKERLGNTTLRSGLEENKTTGEREGQSMSDMQNETTDGIAGSSLNTVQNGGQELNGELGRSLSQLPQQDRENNRKRVEQIKNDCNTEEWNNLSRFICSKCYCLKKDIGGTALKPSIEPICMARKPLVEKTVAENCLKWGTGGINIDESRVETNGEEIVRNFNDFSNQHGNKFGNGEPIKTERSEKTTEGRWPANLLHDNSEEVRECFPDAGKGNGKGAYNYAGREYDNKDTSMFNGDKPQAPSNFNDSGNASRFFKSIIYQAKASKSERNKGCEGLEEKQTWASQEKRESNSFDVFESDGRPKTLNKNNHPTVKPVALMEYLIKMITPPKGIVLDPFTGSGSTGVACNNLGYEFIGCELNEEYIPIIQARLGNPEVVKIGEVKSKEIIIETKPPEIKIKKSGLSSCCQAEIVKGFCVQCCNLA